MHKLRLLHKSAVAIAAANVVRTEGGTEKKL